MCKRTVWSLGTKTNQIISTGNLLLMKVFTVSSILAKPSLIISTYYFGVFIRTAVSIGTVTTLSEILTNHRTRFWLSLIIIHRVQVVAHISLCTVIGLYIISTRNGFGDIMQVLALAVIASSVEIFFANSIFGHEHGFVYGGGILVLAH